MGIAPRPRWICLALAGHIAIAATARAGAAEDDRFKDGLFRRCIVWLLDGRGGAMIGNLCLERYLLPTPSLFQCARKTIVGFASATDREVCAVIFDEQARKARAAPAPEG